MKSYEQPVSEIMTEPVQSVTPETPAREVATTIFEQAIGSVVVADASGIVTKTDLIAGIKNECLGKPISELMTSPVVTISQDATVQNAINRMDKYEIKRLVVENNSEVVGIVSTTDIRQALATELNSVVDIFAGSVETDGECTYECMSCGERVTASSKPGTCPACDAPMRNLNIPRN